MFQWLKNRFRALATNEPLKGSRVERTNSNWQPRGVSGDSAIADGRSLLLARTRDLFENSPSGRKMATLLSDLVVGSGMESYAAPFDESGTLDFDEAAIRRDLEYAIASDNEFEAWKKTADADDELTWGELERLACFEMANTGDAILLECFDRSKDIPLCYQLIEKDQLDVSKDRGADHTGNRIANGIEYRGSKAVAYHVYDVHPDDDISVSAFASTRIPASRIIHAYLRFRPSQRSGISWYQAAITPTRDLDWYLGNELTAAAIGAVLTLIHKSPHHTGALGLADGMDGEDIHGNELVKLGPGLVFRGGLEDSIEMAESKRPSRDATPFIHEIRREQAMAAGVSVSRLTSDYQNHSYTSARAAHLDDDQHIKPLQKFFAERISKPVRMRVNRMASGMGKFAGVVTPSEFRRNERKYQAFDVLGPGREQLDPEAETDAAAGRIRGGMSNLKIENGRRQRHWVRVLRQLAIERSVATSLGVELDFSKQQGGQPGEGAKTTQEASQA